MLTVNRPRENSKRKGGGLAAFLNDITVKEQLCGREFELLAISMQPHYLLLWCYVPLSANANAACDSLHSMVRRLQTQHPQAQFLISGDFNHVRPCPLSSSL